MKLRTPAGSVSAILDMPEKRPIAALALAHGAGAGMKHPFMAELAERLADAGFAVLRFQFPYMEAGAKRTDSPKVATATIAAAVNALREKVDAPVFAGGKSFGARMTTLAASEGLLPDLCGILCFGFPLHTPKAPSVKRAEHLSGLEVPTLFLQGTRDTLADLKLMRGLCDRLPRVRLHVVEGADHGFTVLKRSGRTAEEVIQELVTEAVRFRDAVLRKPLT